MDPDLPLPSIEHDALPETPRLRSTKKRRDQSLAASVPLPLSSPLKTPYGKTRSPSHSTSPHKLSRTSSASSNSDSWRTPPLDTKRSSSNLSASRGVTPSRPEFRRASSNLKPASPAPAMKSLPSSHGGPTRQPITAELVAKDYFQKELDLQSSSPTEVAVVVHDSCYGHRFSRPRTSKASLGTIVERPERILATLLGAAAAYVLLGGRHQDGPHGPHPDKSPPLTQSLPFQIRKVSRSIPLNHPAVTHVHGTKWMEELQIMCDSAETKLALNGKELIRPIGFGKDENGKTLPKLHEGDLYLCAESLAALQGCLGGVCDAVDTVFGPELTQRAFVCIRPPGHHCSSNYPSGFCWLNNVHVGITYAAMNHGLTHAAIIDFDLHHGDGSQSIAWDHNRKAQELTKNAANHKKTPIGYSSLHDINSYPCEWGDEEKVRNASLCIENAHGQSIWNVHLEPWRTHEEFWRLYEKRYAILLDKTRIFLRHHSAKLRASGNYPKAAIFLSAGFDASEWEGAGMQRHKVNVPTDFYAKFTADVVQMAQEEDLGVDGRVLSVLEGGYSDRALTSGVLSHICGLVGDQSMTRSSPSNTGLGSSMVGTKLQDKTAEKLVNKIEQYTPNWWAVDRLEVLEALVAGRLPPPPKAGKDKEPGNYSSPTQASTAKINDYARERRSLSAQLEAKLFLESAPLPSCPGVDWSVAAYELSRLIIPSDRQTLSCRPEDLNAEATRVRRDRQSAIGVATQPLGEPMQLRDRRAKAPATAITTARTSSRNGSRRTTIGAVTELPDPSLNAQIDPAVNGRPRRRSSAASSILSSFQDMKLTETKSEAREAQSVDNLAKFGVRNQSVPLKEPEGALNGKKMKPVTVKGPPKRRSSPKKAPTAAPPSRKNSSGSERVTASDMARPPSRSRRTSVGTNTPSDEMEGLSNGMKKISIKLKMPRAEERSAKQSNISDDHQPKVRIPRKPAVSRAVKPKTATKPSGKALEGATKHLVQTSQAELPSFTATVQNHPNEVDLVTDRSPVMSAPTSLPASHGVRGGDASTIEALPVSASIATNEVALAIPEQSQAQKYNTQAVPPVEQAEQSLHRPLTVMLPLGEHTQPKTPVEDGASSGVAHIRDVNLATLLSIPQNVGEPVDGFKPAPTQSPTRPLTPSRKTKEDLPVFTSSSSIPFGVLKAPAAINPGPDKKNMSIWDLPDTPQH